MKCILTVIAALLIFPHFRAQAQVRKAVEETHNEGFDPSVNQLNLLFKLDRYNGHGVTISVKEQKVDPNDIDLRGRIRASSLSNDFITTHASQMATLIAGAGNSSDFSKGSAWKAQVSSSSFFNLNPDPTSYFLQDKISIQNHSYGTGIESFYGPDSRSYDEQVYQNPWLLHIFSAGNLGDQQTPSGKYKDLYHSNISGSFKMSKNSLSVGAVDSDLLVSSKSSRGPAHDGRIKPELVAYGLDGTSGAAAITSGIAAVIQQVFKDRFDSLPPTALVRAMLMNTAEDIGSTGPDHLSGYGNVQGLEALRSLEQGHYALVSMKGSQSLEFNLPGLISGKQYRVMLAWTDPPATENNNKSLLLDFDLAIKDNLGNLVHPWVLSSFPNEDSLLLPAFKGIDSLNIQEQVSFLATSQDHKVIIRSPAFQGEKQVVLTWYTLPDSLGWSFPVKGDKMKAGEKHTLLLTSPLENDGIVEFKTANNWQKIGIVFKGSRRLSWNTPTQNGVYQLRLILPDTTLYSERFSISTTPQLKVGFVCPDSTYLYWAAGSSVYRLFSLEDNYIDTLNLIADSSITIPTSGSLYAIAENFEGYDGLRSITLLPSRQGVGCYVENFLADLLQDNTARLSLKLGLTQNIQNVVFQKNIGETWVDLSKQQPALNLFYDDDQLTRGFNYYRVLIDLGNKQVLSQQASVFYFGKDEIVLYPNPLPRGRSLKIATRDTENLFVEFFDVTGRKLYSYGPVETIEQVPTGPLRAGVYFFRISRNNQRVGSGRLVIQ